MLTLYSAGRNKGPIFEAISGVLLNLAAEKPSSASSPLLMLEIASGTGEHAAYFTERIPNLAWQPTEFDNAMLDSISAYSRHTIHASNSTILEPLSVDVTALRDDSSLPEAFRGGNVDAMICINMIHISPIESTEALFRAATSLLRSQGVLFTYGPYRVAGAMVESNVAFDISLKARNPLWGIRDLEYVEEVAQRFGIVLENKIDMPSNNMCLVFRKI